MASKFYLIHFSILMSSHNFIIILEAEIYKFYENQRPSSTLKKIQDHYDFFMNSHCFKHP